MKVYLAMAGYDYEGDEVMGVFSTIDKANKCINTLNHSDMGYDSIYIEEREVE
jgi:hypothetical protein